ncbi:MAG: protein containing Coagulation factor 5/8 type [Clostridia bacterium]|nr:protein containing Coagulation factor 5/8 type [Clostridia bacterium]
MTNFEWKEDSIFPTFKNAEETLDRISSEKVRNPHMLLALSALQGIINKKQPRFVITDSHAGEGEDLWLNEAGYTLSDTDPVNVFREYAGEIKGLTVYSDKRSRHFRNLAASMAAISDTIPASPEIVHFLRENGLDFPTINDICDLKLYNGIDIYGYLYENVWKECSHRILFSLNPVNAFQMRDLAAATGSATVWLDCRNNPLEKEVYERFLSDMEAGKSICTGWYTEERSGITTATKYGLSTVPSDYFIAPTLLANGKEVTVRKEPAFRKAENKIYAALFVSDGDNIQYCQHYMRQYWDKNKESRGKSAINWTISPALSEIAPDIMNYYYRTASEKDCFVSGPSGMGYAMPFNTLDEDIPAGNYVKNDEDFGKYAALSNRYFEKCGLRVATIWDNPTENQRNLYAESTPYLYGQTVQLFTDDNEKITSVNRGKIFKQFTPCYCTTVEHLSRVLRREIDKWDGKEPLFIASQISVWGKITLGDIANLEEKLKEKAGGRFEFVRADEFFKTYSELIEKKHNQAAER